MSSTSGYDPVLGIHTNVLSGVTWRTISLNVTVTGSAKVAGSAIATDGGVPSGAGIVTGSNEPVSYQSTSTHPSIPGTVPQLPYCQKVQPLPLQFPAGTVRGRDAPVRDPQHRVPGGGDGRRVARARLPAVRARVDHGSNPEPLGHAVQPVEDPLRDLRLGESSGPLDVEHRDQVAGFELCDVDEVVGLDDGVVGRAVGSREVVGAEHDARHLRPGLVERVVRIDERAAFGRLREREPLVPKPATCDQSIRP